MKRIFALVTMVSVAVFGLCSQASASFVYSLGVANPGLAGFSGPYGTATVTLLDLIHARIDFVSNDVGGISYLFGGRGAFAFNINTDSWSVSEGPFSNRFPGFTPGPQDQTGTGNEDIFGSFDFRADSMDGYAHAITNASFDITNFGGFWASDADVLAPNSLGNYVAAHVFATTYPANPDIGPIAEGFTTDGSAGNNGVPEPTSMLLFGLGLVGLGAARRRQKS